ncbi:MAG: hypothetical protein JNN28_08460 [Saprospiraceae bacterium]|nr:hypothetical protein [Saprospiraceae bacterium]
MKQHFNLTSQPIPASRSYERGKFGRLFPWLSPCMVDSPRSRSDIFQIARTMYQGTNADNNMPAGYTYLGQFIIHDISFDPTSIGERSIDPEYLWNFRTPALDLDSVYGSGPNINPFLYKNTLTANSTQFYLPAPDKNGDQDPSYQNLPRLGKTAVIADPRNDENIIISQLHATFLTFHNRIVERLKKENDYTGNEAMLFRKAQQIVKWSYQWVVLYDYLPRIIDITNWYDLDTYKASALKGLDEVQMRKKRLQLIRDLASEKISKKYFDWRNEPFVPLEFSAAAFRFGHSQVRGIYVFNQDPSYIAMGESEQLQSLFASKPYSPFRVDMRLFFSDNTDAINFNHGIDTKIAMALRNIPSQLGIDNPNRENFLQLIKGLKGINNQLSRKLTEDEKEKTIDALLSLWLNDLQTEDVKKFILDTSLKVNEKNIAELNLTRGMLLGLPSGQDVARAMGIPPLKVTTANFPSHLQNNTPLWYYILYEAQENSQSKRLGPVGSQIVCEVIVGLIKADKSSFLNQDPKWVPKDKNGLEKRSFSMIDIIQIAEEG